MSGGDLIATVIGLILVYGLGFYGGRMWERDNDEDGPR